MPYTLSTVRFRGTPVSIRIDPLSPLQNVTLSLFGLVYSVLQSRSLVLTSNNTKVPAEIHDLVGSVQGD